MAAAYMHSADNGAYDFCRVDPSRSARTAEGAQVRRTFSIRGDAVLRQRLILYRGPAHSRRLRYATFGQWPRPRHAMTPSLNLPLQGSDATEAFYPAASCVVCPSLMSSNTTTPSSNSVCRSGWPEAACLHPARMQTWCLRAGYFLYPDGTQLTLIEQPD